MTTSGLRPSPARRGIFSFMIKCLEVKATVLLETRTRPTQAQSRIGSLKNRMAFGSGCRKINSLLNRSPSAGKLAVEERRHLGQLDRPVEKRRADRAEQHERQRARVHLLVVEHV